MGLRLQCGPINSGRIREVKKKFVECCLVGEGAWLIVPTNGDARRLREEISLEHEVLIGASIGTFRSFADSVVMPTKDVISDVAAQLIVSGLIDSGRFSQSVGFPSFARTAYRRICDVRRAMAVSSVQQSEMRCLSLVGLTKRERGMWIGLANDFNESLELADLHDSTRIETECLRILNSGDIVTEPVFVYGFEDLDEVQRLTIAAAAKRCDAVVTLPFEPGRLAHERRRATIDYFSGIGVPIEMSGSSHFSSAQLSDVEKHLWETTTPEEPDGGDVKFVECCGALQQAEEVAREIAILIQHHGIEPGRIACISLSQTRDRALYEHVLARAGIPFNFQYSRSLGDTPVGRVILDLIEGIINQDHQQFLAGARSDMVQISREILDVWDDRVNAASQSEAGTSLEDDWFDEFQIYPAIARMIELCAGKRNNSTEQVLGLIRSLSPTSQSEARVVSSCISELERLEQAYDAEDIPVRRLFAGLASLSIPPSDTVDSDAVLFAPAGRVRTARFDAVVLFDLHDGSDGGAVTEGQMDEAPSLMRDLSYVASTRAWSKLTLVRKSATSTGSMLAAHPLWNEIRRLFPSSPIRRRRLSQVKVNDALVQMPWEAVTGGDTSQVVAQLNPSAGAHWKEQELDRPISVSDLEEWSSCPARWLIRRQLLAGEVEPSTGRQIVGTLAHEALAHFVPGLPEIPSRDVVLDYLHSKGRMLYSGPKAGGKTATPASWHYAQALEITMTFLSQESIEFYEDASIVDCESEVGFGGTAESRLPGLRIGRHIVNGRIDRIDTLDNGEIALHDYKLTKEAPQANALNRLRKFQLSAYWLAYGAATGQEPAAAVYRPLETPGRARGIVNGEVAPHFNGEYRNDRFASEDIEALIDESKNLMILAADGIKDGYFPSKPIEGECPTWCNFSDICRVDDEATDG